MRSYPLPQNLGCNDIFDGISDQDNMFIGDIEHYYRVGLSAKSIINKAIALSQKDASEFKNILDLPSGYGRVTRFLKPMFPFAELTVSDLDREAVDFCRKNFLCNGVYSDADFSKVQFDNKFDLIWVGSLITHFSEDMTINFFKFAAKYLRSGGLLIVSSHGPFVAGLINGRLPNESYGLPSENLQTMLKDFFKNDYGYSDYPGQPNYGISIIREEWFKKSISLYTDLRVYCHFSCAWDNHHDIVVLTC